MDHVALLNKVRSRKTLEQAFEYAVFDRIRVDYFVNFFEIEYFHCNKDRVIGELIQELLLPHQYRQRPAFAFFPPKSHLCFRRMIYLHFKDLVVRYAFAMVFAEIMDPLLAPSCFANRIASNEQKKNRFLADFSSESWPNFCNWQKKQSESQPVFLRTDISAFYDSVSHDLLIETIVDKLSVPHDSPLIELFRRVLVVPTQSYSSETGDILTDEIRHGLPIGNNTEGFFANLYLLNVDSAMLSHGIQFGRYCDDMRLFGESREKVLKAIRVLQEMLLTKNLNLNAAKTKFAGSENEKKKYRSKADDVYTYFIEDEEGLDEEIVPGANPQVSNLIDHHFDDLDKEFVPYQALGNERDGKDFCKFLSSQTRDEGWDGLRIRSPEQVKQLATVLLDWSGSSRHAAWLIVQSAFYDSVPLQTKATAIRVIFRVLLDPAINPSAKYRILHHLAKPRTVKHSGRNYTHLENLSNRQKSHLESVLSGLLKVPAFELGIAVLYTFKALGASVEDLHSYVQAIPSPNADPYKNILFYIESLESESVPVIASSLATDDEPVDTMEWY